MKQRVAWTALAASMVFQAVPPPPPAGPRWLPWPDGERLLVRQRGSRTGRACTHLVWGSLHSPPGAPQAIRSGLEEISDTQAAFMSPFNVVTPRSPATRSNWLRSSSSLSVSERRSSASRICRCTGPPLGPDNSTLLVSTQPDAALDRLRRPRDTICALPGLPWAMARARSSHHSKARIRPS